MQARWQLRVAVFVKLQRVVVALQCTRCWTGGELSYWRGCFPLRGGYNGARGWLESGVTASRYPYIGGLGVTASLRSLPLLYGCVSAAFRAVDLAYTVAAEGLAATGSFAGDDGGNKHGDTPQKGSVRVRSM
jgi:hypothetical protein